MICAIIALIIVGALLFCTKSEPFQLSGDNKVLILSEYERNKRVAELSQYISFKFINASPKDLDIFYENESNDLNHLVRLEKLETKYVFLVEPILKPGTLLFSKFVDNGEFAFKPYPMSDSDYSITFGEVSTDNLRTDYTVSDRNEILSLKIINRSLTPYYVWYRGTMLGKVEAYHPSKFEVDYSILTTNNDKHFQLGTCLEFDLDSPGATRQSIVLERKTTNIVYLGDVVGKDEYNR